MKSLCLVDMNMFARFDEIPLMTLQDRKQNVTDERENSKSHTNTDCGGIN